MKIFKSKYFCVTFKLNEKKKLPWKISLWKGGKELQKTDGLTCYGWIGRNVSKKGELYEEGVEKEKIGGCDPLAASCLIIFYFTVISL